MLNELYNDLEYKTLLEHISSQYKGNVVLDRKQTAAVLGIWYIHSWSSYIAGQGYSTLYQNGRCKEFSHSVCDNGYCSLYFSKKG